MEDIHEFHQRNMDLYNKMRNTPHTCDYDYTVTNYSGTNMFFEICKLCMDTRGVIEI